MQIKEEDGDQMRGGRVIVIGASAGGFHALQEVLANLRSDGSIAIIVCQHIEKSARLNYQLLFRDVAQFALLEVEDKQRILPGNIYFAPPGYHLYVESEGYFSLSLDPLVNWSRPSIDVLFESAAHAYGPSLIGIILSGANGDGAHGIREIKRLGGDTIAQDPKSAVAKTMPRIAIETGCVDYVLDLSEIAAQLERLVNEGHNSSKGAL